MRARNAGFPASKQVRGSGRRVWQWVLRHRALSAILLGAFVLRLVPVLWGIPLSPFVQSYHPDEPKVYHAILHFPGIYWSTEAFPGYGTAVQYTLGLLLLPVKLLLVKILDMRELYAIVVWIMGRLASITMGTASVYLVYRLACRLFDERTAIVSALFLASSFYHTLNSSIITVDVATSFFIALNILLCLRAIEDDRLSSYFAFGIGTGLLLGTKLPAGIFLVIPLLLGMQKALGEGGGTVPGKNRITGQLQRFTVYGATALGVFLIFHPHILLDPAKFISFFLVEKHDWMDRVATSVGGMLRIWQRETVAALGGGVALLALLGMLIPGKANLRYKLALIAFVVLYTGFWRWFLKGRYVIAVAPILCLFAAHLCVRLLDSRWRMPKWIGGGAVAVVFLTSLSSVLSAIHLRLNDTRPPAARYLLENIPAGTTVGIAGVSEKYPWKTHRWRYPRVDFTRFKAVDFLQEPDILILSSYDYQPVLHTLESGRLGSGYVLDEAYHREWYRFAAPSPGIFEFYDRLLNQNDGRYVLFKSFSTEVKVPLEFPPPEIRIYRRTL